MLGSLDLALYRGVASLAEIDLFVWLYVFLGSWMAWLLAFAFPVLFFLSTRTFKERFYYATLAFLSTALSFGVIASLVRLLVSIPRPFVALGAPALITHPDLGGMPSGHMAFFIPLGLTLYALDRRTGRWFLGLVLLMGLMRVVIGVHWVSDIVAGILLGAASFFAVKRFLPR